MRIAEASAKVRAKTVADDEEDYALAAMGRGDPRA